MTDNKNKHNGAPLSDLIDKIMKSYRLDGKMKEMDILAKWPEMMGIAVSNRTKKIEIRNGILFLEMESSVMRDELLHGKQIIIERINQEAGEKIINDVWFQ